VTGVHRDAPGPARLPELAPVAHTEHEYEGLVARPSIWRLAGYRVCAQLGIQQRGDPEVVTAGWFPVVRMPPDHVVKFYAHWKDGHETLEDEWKALSLLERDRSLPVPRPIARSSGRSEWRYIVMSHIAGRTVRGMRAELEATENVGLATWLGRFIARIHRVAITENERHAAWPGVQASVARRYRRATELVASYRTVPTRLLDQVEGWLPPLADLLGTPGDLVVTHGELTDKHVLADTSPGFAPTGVIDFGLAGIGYPLDDLGPVWWYALRCERALTDAFLETADLPGYRTPGFPRIALAWALIHPIARFPIPGIEAIRSLDELAWRAFGE
jgi:aminoglycoside phosphotransferase (APT) family kinase protein